MEVHHHPHIGKKKFKEYIIEGLMIFFAVTMGFFAEQFREYIVERKQEVEIMHNLVEDLHQDQLSLKSADNWYNNQLIPAGDSIKYLLNNPNTYSNDNSLYVNFRYVIRYLSIDVSVNNKTYNQLKNNKGFSLIQNKILIDSINKYYNNIDIIRGLEGYLFQEKQELRQILPKILNGNMYDQVVNEKDHVIRPINSLKSKEITEELKNELLIRLSDINSVSRNIVNRIMKLELQSKLLSEHISKNYEFKNRQD